MRAAERSARFRICLRRARQACRALYFGDPGIGHELHHQNLGGRFGNRYAFGVPCETKFWIKSTSRVECGSLGREVLVGKSARTRIHQKYALRALMGSLCCGLAYIYITGLQICSLVWTKLNVSVLRCQCIKTKYIVRLFIDGDLYKCQYSKLCDDFYRVHGSGRMWVTWQLAINGAITTCSRPLIIVSCSCPVHCTNALETSTRELCWAFESSLPYSIVGWKRINRLFLRRAYIIVAVPQARNQI